MCCLFAPGLEFFKRNLEFYASKSEWVEAKNGLDAIKEYRRRHYRLTRGNATGYVKILKENEITGVIKDEDSGKDIALEVMVNYYVDNSREVV